MTLCEPACDPLVQDCPVGEVCTPPDLGADGFVCVADVSGAAGQVGDVCSGMGACDPGLECMAAGEVPGCGGARCCTPYCDVTQPNACPLPGQSCVAWTMKPLPGFEKVGVCAVP